ncbi:MAG TPA: TetR/AcrR family transcriptional regulator C-terminal ligand-binding domain-containing protein [Mycobacteriales bacterium]|nr:TetR/AcrR family transcriptional regulator C-terminal ligand-binding domain-containing protein [Mycobacteriales bacterium]
MSTREPAAAQRPGGRTARVRAAVHRAATELLTENAPEDLTIAAVAQRSGVHQATIYRRWGTISALIDDLVTAVLDRSSPVPDTGSLRGDLTAFALKAARDLATPMGAAYLRAIAHTVATSDVDPDRPEWQGRGKSLQQMLDRAAARGEPAPDLEELLEVVLAPMYFRILLAGRVPDQAQARRLVERQLTLCGSNDLNRSERA